MGSCLADEGLTARDESSAPAAHKEDLLLMLSDTQSGKTRLRRRKPVCPSGDPYLLPSGFCRRGFFYGSTYKKGGIFHESSKMQQALSPNANLVFGDVPFTGVNMPLSAFDTTDTEIDCHFKPTISFAEGVKLTMEWIKSVD